jgi:uncharacterized lipoprotein YmbA
MPEPISRLLLILATAALAACGSVPPKHFYTLVNEKPRPPRDNPICTRPLVMAPVEAVSPYDSSKIVYRSDPYNVDFYHYRLWAAGPEDMLEELLSQRLANSNIFPGVERYIHSSSDHLALFARINAIEEIDRGEEWTARMAMTFVLKDPRDDSVAWRHSFDRTEPVREKKPAQLVRTLSRIYHVEAEKMVSALEMFILGFEGCREEEEKPGDE